jgi:hypothetical protein
MTPASCRSGLAWDTIPGWPVEDADAALEAAGVWAAATGKPVFTGGYGDFVPDARRLPGQVAAKHDC